MRRNISTHAKNKFVLVLAGPTASGKTSIALQLAERLGGEIISADSRQVYKFLDIGTAKPSAAQQKKVKHYFVDELFPDELFNAGEFGKRGRAIIDDIIRRGNVPIVAGGSGLYIQGLIDGFFEGPSKDDVVREQLEERMRNEGGNKLLDELQIIDPVAAANMLPSHTRRIIRAHEVYRLTGIPISQFQQSRIAIDFIPVFTGLQWERKALYGRIDARVDWMMEQGFVDEVRRLWEKGYSFKRLPALQTVGYKEINDYLDGKISLERAVELMKQNSRRYAKRQLTWFRHDERIRWFNVNVAEELSSIVLQIEEYFRITADWYSLEKNTRKL